MDYRVLVVEPKTDLPLATDEVDQVINALGAQRLGGSQANIHGLLSMLKEPFDIVWFATHGDEGGIYLNDGLLATSEITALVRSAGVKLVVLNTCSSKMVALHIYDELRIDLVCTLRKIPDRTAFITGTLFARKIAEGYSFREAYELAKPGQNYSYAYLPEKEKQMPPYERQRSRVEYDLDDVMDLARNLERAIKGDEYGTTGLIPTVNLLIEKVELLRQDFVVLRNNQVVNRRLLLTALAISVSLLVAVTIIVFQQDLI